MDQFKERRRFPRLQQRVPLQLASDAGPMSVETQNISATGANCLLDRQLPLMTRLDLTILVPEQTPDGVIQRGIRCLGVIVRSEPVEDHDDPRFETAIYFSHIERADQTAIQRYIEYTLSTQQGTRVR